MFQSYNKDVFIKISIKCVFHCEMTTMLQRQNNPPQKKGSSLFGVKSLSSLLAQPPSAQQQAQEVEQDISNPSSSSFSGEKTDSLESLNNLPIFTFETENFSSDASFEDFLRQTEAEEYLEAVNATEYLFMGRHQDTLGIKNYSIFPDNIGRILHPERKNKQWTVEKNMAFVLGGIESGKKFKFLTPLANIANRAKRGLTGECIIKEKLGYAAAELLWLQDNGYTFEPDANNPKHTWAMPPTVRVEKGMINPYGHTYEDDVVDQIQRVKDIADSLNLPLPRSTSKNKPKRCDLHTLEENWNNTVNQSTVRNFTKKKKHPNDNNYQGSFFNRAYKKRPSNKQKGTPFFVKPFSSGF